MQDLDLPDVPDVVAFAVIRDGRDWVPVKFTIKDGAQHTYEEVGSRGPWRATAYEYLSAAVMDHYRAISMGKIK